LLVASGAARLAEGSLLIASSAAAFAGVVPHEVVLLICAAMGVEALAGAVAALYAALLCGCSGFLIAAYPAAYFFMRLFSVCFAPFLGLGRILSAVWRRAKLTRLPVRLVEHLEVPLDLPPPPPLELEMEMEAEQEEEAGAETAEK
jgi:hypothetical protein